MWDALARIIGVFMTNNERAAHAQAIYEEGMRRVRETPPPAGQKFAPGTRVMIADDLGSMMAHFPAGRPATVLYTYAHAFGGDDVRSYALDVDGHGDTAWYEEHQLTAIAEEWPEVIGG